MSPFHLVAGMDSEKFASKVVRLILQNGGDPNVRSNEDELTPVHVAALWGRLKVLKLLLHSGGDPLAKDADNHTPLYYAKREDHQDCYKLLDDFVKSTRKTAHAEYDKRLCYSREIEKVIIHVDDTVGEYAVSECQIDTREHLVINREQHSTAETKTSHTEEWTDILEQSDTTQAVTTNELNDFRTPKNNISFNTHSFKVDKGSFSTLAGRDFSPESGIEELPKNENMQNIEQDYGLVKGTLAGSEINVNNSAESASSNILNQAVFVSLSEVSIYKDSKADVVLVEERIVRSPASSLQDDGNSSRLSSLPSSFDYDSDTLRNELILYNIQPGPITKTTKRVYLRKLYQVKSTNSAPATSRSSTDEQKLRKKTYSYELEKTFRSKDWLCDVAKLKNLEEVIVREFNDTAALPKKKWREGITRVSFTYLLLDPRYTTNLINCHPDTFAPITVQTWKTFLSAIFYVGKGKRSRPYAHLYKALSLWNNGERTHPKHKIQTILDIWSSGCGVICLHLFHNCIPVEAYTREAAMIAALKLENVCNEKSGDFYGACVAWPIRDKRNLGVFLLYKALSIFLLEGERHLRPNDID